MTTLGSKANSLANVPTTSSLPLSANAAGSGSRMASGKWVLVLAALGLALVTAVTYVQRPGEPGFALFWPSAGLGLALALRFGWLGLLATAAGVALWAMVVMQWSPSGGIWAGAAASVGPAWVWWRVRSSWGEAASPFERLPLLLAFLREQGLGGSVLAASVGTVGLWAAGQWPGDLHPVAVWAVYWLLETSGSLLFAPVGVWFVSPLAEGQRESRWQLWMRASWSHRVGMLSTAALTGAVVALMLLGRYEWAQAALYGLLPLLVLIALRAPPFLIHTLLLGAAALVLFALAFLKRQPVWNGNDTLFLAFILYLMAGAGVVLVVAATMDERRRSELRLARAALIDPLTGLGNEAGLLHRLEEQMRHAAPASQNQLLIAVSVGADRQRPDDQGLVARTRSDRDMADRLRALALPVWWSRVGLGVFRGVWVGEPALQPEVLGAVCGVCAQPQTGQVGGQWTVAAATVPLPKLQDCPAQVRLDVLKQAEFRALQFRRLEQVEVTADAAEALSRDAALADWLRSTIASRRLTLVAQPIVTQLTAATATDGGLPDPPTRLPPKAEVLVRLTQPNGDQIAPARFLPVAMRAGLMPQLDRAVVEMTVQAMAEADSRSQARCAINLSGPTVVDDQLANWVGDLLERHGIEGHRLVFEVTESMAMTDLDSAAQTLAALRSLGCQVAIDDFGTGMATFDYLKRFPVDALKIDGSFIQPLADGDGVDRVIVESMVRVARSLGLRTVAEYVSSPELQRAVAALGIDECQGYAVGMPQPLAQWLNGAGHRH